MIRFLIFRFLVPLLILLLLRSVLRTLLAGFQSASRSRSARQRNIPAAAELKKDPVCGTYVSAAASLTCVVHGKTLHFCSEECLKKYRAA
jgi:YHS domain-containing protein